MSKRVIVGITGRSGCGKSTLSACYASKGYLAIDCDETARKVREIPRCIDRLVGRFGPDICKDGKIIASALAKKAFADSDGLQKLTRITHPFIIDDILKTADEAFDRGDDVVFVDGAVIVGHRFEKYCDKIIVVVTSFENRMARIMKRDSLTENQAKSRLSGRDSYRNMIRKADWVINNNGTAEELITQGEFVLDRLLESI